MDVKDLQLALLTRAKSSGGTDVCGQTLSGRVVSDSRQVDEGDVFVAVRGPVVDGHAFIDQAMSRGAGVVVVDESADVCVGDGAIPIISVKDSASILGTLAQAAAGEPGKALTCLGVTGTNGKTTIAYLVRWILNRAGVGCGMIGTVEHDLGDDRMVVANNTTPGAVELAGYMNAMVANGLDAVVMECSSHGLDQGRLAGIDFAGAAFTNLTGDHLDYHKTPDAYLAAKAKLFAGLSETAVAVLNAQDKAWMALQNATRAKVWRYGIGKSYEVAAFVRTMTVKGSSFDLSILSEKVSVETRLVGEHNISNMLAAAGLAHAAGVGIDAIAEGLSSFAGVPGRLERVDAGQDFSVFVDYAHTDDALSHVLETMRTLNKGRIIVVFGCGGDRDRSKRPRMASVAQRLADVIVVTNDNPRNEDPQAIIADIRSGFAIADMDRIHERQDRREAIELAMEIARSGDVVVIAGKGHEDYQVIGEDRFNFDDRRVAYEAIQATGAGK